MRINALFWLLPAVICVMAELWFGVRSLGRDETDPDSYEIHEPVSYTHLDVYKRQIPPIPTAFFKRHTLWTMDPGCLAVRATSSGTGGLVSRIGLEWAALARGAAMAAGLGKARGLFSPVPANYIVLGYEPHRENQRCV